MVVSALLALIFVNPNAVLGEMISAGTSSFTLCLELVAIYAVWLGLLELVDKSGLSEKIAKLLRPLIRKLFKTKTPESERLIAMNLSANMLGLGNASTPLGMQAVKELDDNSGIATFGIIMLIVVNTTSIQLLPSTIIGLRTTAGSQNPADIILPTLISTTITTGVGILLVLLCEKIRKARKK